DRKSTRLNSSHVSISYAVFCLKKKGIRFANGSHRPPKIVVVFRFPNTHARIRHCDVDQREQASEFERSEFRLIRDLDGDLVIESWWGTETGSSIICPKRTDECLFGRALRRGINSVPTKILGFVVGSGISGTCKGRRRGWLELARRLHHKRFASAPMRA